jgi:hypothetical protein
MRRESPASNATADTGTLASHKLRPDHVAPPLCVCHSPPAGVPTMTCAAFCGSTASAETRPPTLKGPISSHDGC